MAEILNFHEHSKQLKITPQNLMCKLWRVQNLYPIRQKSGMLTPFKLNKHQLKIAIQLMKNVSNKDYSPIVILKARQLGISTFFCIWFLDDCLWYEGVSAVIQSYKHETNYAIFKIATIGYQFMYNLDGYTDTDQSRLPNRIKQNEINDKKSAIIIPSLGSCLECKLDVRGTSTNRVHFSEYAYTPEDRIKATIGSMAKDTIKVYESTPNGPNHFEDLYHKQKELNPKNVFFFPWYTHDEYRLPVPKEGLGPLSVDEKKEKENCDLTDEQIQWWRDTDRQLSAVDDEHSSFRVEFPFNDGDCFASASRNALQSDVLMRLRKQCEQSKLLEKFWDGNLLIKVYKKIDYEELKEQNKNICISAGVDSSGGTGGDYSGCVVLLTHDSGFCEVIMTMRGFENPTLFAPKIKKYLFKYYGRKIQDGKHAGKYDFIPYVVIEQNNHGHALIQKFREYYPSDSMYWHHKPDGHFTKSWSPGFNTTEHTRRHILGITFNLINEDMIKMNDPVLANEFRTLVRNDVGKIEADKGKNDDMVISLCLAYQGWWSHYGKATGVRNRLIKEGYTKADADAEVEDEIEVID